MNNEESKKDLINKINEQNKDIQNLIEKYEKLKNKCENLKNEYINMNNKNSNEENYEKDFIDINPNNKIIKNHFISNNNINNVNNGNSNINNYFNPKKKENSSSLKYSNINFNKFCYNYDFNFVNQDKYKLVLNRSNIYDPIICSLIQIDFDLNYCPNDTFLICLNPNPISFENVRYSDTISKSYNDKQIQEFKIKLKFDQQIKCGVYDVKAGLYSKKEGRLTKKEAIIKITIKE